MLVAGALEGLLPAQALLQLLEFCPCGRVGGGGGCTGGGGGSRLRSTALAGPSALWLLLRGHAACRGGAGRLGLRVRPAKTASNYGAQGGSWRGEGRGAGRPGCRHSGIG